MQTIYLNPKLRYANQPATNNEIYSSKRPDLDLDEIITSTTEEEAEYLIDGDSAYLIYRLMPISPTLSTINHTEPQLSKNLSIPSMAARAIYSPVQEEDIIYFESEGGSYTTIHFADQTKDIMVIGLKRLANFFPSFIRIHRSFIVNPHYIETFLVKKKNELTQKVNYELKIQNGPFLPWSRRGLRTQHKLLKQLFKGESWKTTLKV